MKRASVLHISALDPAPFPRLAALVFALAAWLLLAVPTWAAEDMAAAKAEIGLTKPDPAASSPLLKSSMAAADALSGMLYGRLGPGTPILAASLSDLEDLNQSSPMGRLISQQIASRLSENGYTVLDARLRGDMKFETGGGEFLLSRDTGQLKHSYAAEAALTGTYSRGADRWYISTRVLRLADSAILAAYEYTLPLNGADVRAGGGGTGAAAAAGGTEAAGGAAVNAADWQRYAPRQQAVLGGSAGRAASVSGWMDPAKMPQLKPLTPIKKKYAPISAW